MELVILLVFLALLFNKFKTFNGNILKITIKALIAQLITEYNSQRVINLLLFLKKQKILYHFIEKSLVRFGIFLKTQEIEKSFVNND